MKIVTIDENNIDQEHICCAIGNDKQNQSRAQSKKAWMKERFKDGLVSNGCVKATCLGGIKNGYKVILVKDGHSNFNKNA